MQLDHLRYLIALNEQGSVTKASLTLHTTPQNVSRILKKMEQELNTLLFVRTPDGVHLTREGKTFLHFARSTIYHYDETVAKMHLQSIPAPQTHEIILYSNEIVNVMVLNKILTRFAQEYPAMLVKNIVTDWKKGMQQLAADPLSLGFLCHLPDREHDALYAITPMMQQQPVAIVHTKHPLAQQKKCRKEQLLAHKLVTYSRGDIVDTVSFQALNLNAKTDKKTIASTGNLEACYQLAANGDYIYIGDTLESFLSQDISLRNSLVALPIIDQPLWHFALFKHRSLPAASPQSLLYAFILAHFDQALLDH